MKVCIYHGKKDVRMEKRGIPQIVPKDVLLKVLAGRICGTDIVNFLVDT